MKVYINSKMTGNAKKETVNGRDHTVVEMVSIVGDSVMNKGFYPDEEVTNSYQQLNCLPAPNGHPKIAGKPISAFHPVAINAHNIGAFIRNPKKSGKVVTNELWIDEEVANKTDGGKELLKRIDNGDDNIGVSTGLTLDQRVENGIAEDGSEYEWIANNFHFDHVAILLNEKAAGAHVGTKLTINEDGEKEFVEIVQLNELSVQGIEDQLRDLLKEEHKIDGWIWIAALFPDSKQVVYEVNQKDEANKLYKRGYAVDSNDVVSLLDDSKEVVRKITYVETGSNAATNSEKEPMPKEQNNGKDSGGKAAVNGDKTQDESKVLNVANAMELLESKGMVINSKEENEDLSFYSANKTRIQNLLQAEDDRLDAKRKKIVENSELTEEDVAAMSENQLTRIENSLVLNSDNSLRQGKKIETNSGDDMLDDYSLSAFENNNSEEATDGK